MSFACCDGNPVKKPAGYFAKSGRKAGTGFGRAGSGSGSMKEVVRGLGWSNTAASVSPDRHPAASGLPDNTAPAPPSTPHLSMSRLFISPLPPTPYWRQMEVKDRAEWRSTEQRS
jgi:hypothetical protein